MRQQLYWATEENPREEGNCFPPHIATTATLIMSTFVVVVCFLYFFLFFFLVLLFHESNCVPFSPDFITIVPSQAFTTGLFA